MFSSKLSWWSRNTLGNIFEAIKEKEKIVANLEDLFNHDNSVANMVKLNKSNAHL